jgi:hypothetical protein
MRACSAEVYGREKYCLKSILILSGGTTAS